MARIGESKVSSKFLTSVPKAVQVYLELDEGDFIEYYTPDHDFPSWEGVMAIKVRKQYATVALLMRERR
jgi:bifunctional DNA-binding transcriptional regulator/antitoxin component of YhaV-PrlF toxin-antitoxin module